MAKNLNIVEHTVEFAGQQLVLTNLSALYIPELKALVLADIHIGKSTHFQKHGIAIPNTIFRNDLNKLEMLIHHFNPQKIIVVGDMFHAENNSEIQQFKDWKTQNSDVQFVLIKGNHDRYYHSIYKDLDVEIMQNELTWEGITFIHNLEHYRVEGCTVSGHLHPGIYLKAKARQHIKLPCFAIGKQHLILPAFSEFTGLNARLDSHSFKFFAFTETGFFEF
ncbi:ligase-associated DNA damage response endonuclease PdeM [Paucihalobacter sp.]|uniref:ligase-associated DNA damage response endonuclease PdeM n=1 Tax=Paucihalobacter sp. TaxID=2850405 RepID=UPI002FE0FC9F